MPNPLNVPITPPRVAFLDPRTGAVSREWYMFFLSLFQTTDDSSISVDDLQKGPDVASELSSLQHENNKDLQALALYPSPPQLGTMSPMNKDFMDFIGWNQNAGVAVQPGQMAWNSGDGTLDIGMGYDGVVQQVGLETYYRIKASADISNGDLVMYDGAVGASGVLKGKPSTTGLTNGQLIMGVATMDIANNDFGYVTCFGIVRGINTTGSSVGETWADGDILYYNTAYTGALTNVAPIAPDDKVMVAAVVHAGPGGSGSLLVRVHANPHLSDLSDVDITSVTDNDLIKWSSGNSRWENISPQQVMWGAEGVPVVKTTDITVYDNETWIINNKSGSTCTIYLPTASTYPGRRLCLQNYQAQLLVSSASNVVPLVGGAAGTAILAAVAGETCTLVSNGTNWLMTQYTPNNVLLLE